ncbi:MAG: GPR endopeptidase [Flavonifractor plautii]
MFITNEPTWPWRPRSSGRRPPGRPTASGGVESARRQRGRATRSPRVRHPGPPGRPRPWASPVGTYVTLELDRPGLAAGGGRLRPGGAGPGARSWGAAGPGAERAPPWWWAWATAAMTPDAIGPKALPTSTHGHPPPGLAACRSTFGSFRRWPPCAAGCWAPPAWRAASWSAPWPSSIRPACVVAVDALASRSLRRVCRTIQLADTGITPAPAWAMPAALNAGGLGVPVICRRRPHRGGRRHPHLRRAGRGGQAS